MSVQKVHDCRRRLLRGRPIFHSFRGGLIPVKLARLKEGVTRSPVDAGSLEGNQFADASASLWIDSELVHTEDLVLHDATVISEPRPPN